MPDPFRSPTHSDDASLDRSIKVEVKKKHLSNGWPFPRFAAHVIEQDLF